LLDGFEKTLTAARQGEQSQLGVLLNVYRRYLLSVASEKLPQEVIAKAAPSDLVQETLFQACRAFDGFRGSSEQELRAWLNRILARKIIEVHRYYRGFAKRDISREIRLSDVQRDDNGMGGVGSSPSPTELAGEAETARSFDDALSTLNEEQRIAIQLRSIEQLSFEEVGVRLGRSADAAQKLWGRAIRNLTRALKPHDTGS
jgi:RNA polymerase sigma-70 factor (ECF subfamily)